MQKVTVAIADTDLARRAKLEQSLQGEQDIKVLTNIISEGREDSTDHQLDSGADITEFEDVIARIGRL
jgi:hypothetical protein